MASKTTLQGVDDPSLAFDPIKVGGDVALAQVQGQLAYADRYLREGVQIAAGPARRWSQ